MTFWAWFTIITGSATLISLAIAGTGWRSDRQMRRLQADIHAATQATLTDMNKGFRESQERLGQALAEGHKALAEGHKILGEAVKGLGDTLARMDERWAQAFERMDQRADDRHRESLQAIQALRG